MRGTPGLVASFGRTMIRVLDFGEVKSSLPLSGPLPELLRKAI